MHPDLAPLRHARGLLQEGTSTTDAVDALQHAFDLDYADSVAAVAAASLLMERNFALADDPEPIVRPFVRHAYPEPDLALDVA